MYKIVAAVLAVAAIGLSACSSGGSSPTVPRISGTGTGAGDAHGYSGARADALHTAAECIRSHGVPSYQDPVLTAGGQVFTDQRSIQNLQQSSDRGAAVQRAIEQACGALMARAGLNPQDEPPAPPRLVAAGVTAAQCLRAHGMPNYRDPTSSTPYTPGHGFGITADEMPNNGAGGKGDPTFQRATAACRTELDAETRASTLSSLAHD
jgi:hypothetical protein